MSILNMVILVAHFGLLTLLCLFGLHRLSMVVRWFYHRNFKPESKDSFSELPKITVQIPLYNERCVAKRIVDTVAEFDYPSDKLQIQIVDDSNDVTSDIIADRVAYHQQQGINIEHVQRENRQGYKAGALKDAMISATGEFIAIFDADFIPPPAILKNTIDHFTNQKVGMIQFRWEHLNRFRSPLTEAQSMMLDAHFSLEQKVRSASNLFFNFNGTAGIWRKETIIDAGNWSADTLTEDLDLSYRAQLRGWEMLYLNDVECPGELPADMNAFKSQQHRWAKGGIQVMMKMLLTVWRSPVGIKRKIESTFHLSNNLAYFIMLIDTVFLLIPSLLIRDQLDMHQTLWLDIPLLVMSTGGHLAYFIFGQIALGNSLAAAFKNLPRLLLLGIQLAINNARAATEALMGQESEFVRTPKTGDSEGQPSLSAQLTTRIYSAVSPKGAGLELLLAVVYTIVFMWALSQQLWLTLPFLLLLIVGFITTAIDSFTSQTKLSS